MKIDPKSSWNHNQIVSFLSQVKVPVRISFNDGQSHPRICSLWFLFDENVLWLASHQNAYLIRQLKNDSRVSFEVSTNEYPYKGVRGKAAATLHRENAGEVLGRLIDKYLGDSNRKLAEWLMSRVEDEYAIRLTFGILNAWDFSDRMES